MFSKFDAWYRPEGQGSGPGSSPDYTRDWTRFLSEFIEENGIKSIVDWGCGDWQYFPNVDIHGARYIGVDVSPTLVERLSLEHPEHRFLLFTGSDDPQEFFECILKSEGLEAVDLIICKDVIQHLPNSISVALIRAFMVSGKHVLLTNDLNDDEMENGGPTVNTETEIAGGRHVDPRRSPFDAEFSHVHSQGSSGEKKTFLFKMR